MSAEKREHQANFCGNIYDASCRRLIQKNDHIVTERIVRFYGCDAMRRLFCVQVQYFAWVCLFGTLQKYAKWVKYIFLCAA